MSAQARSWAPLLITVAPNGARLTRAEHPAVPVTAEEIGRTAAACAKAGAGMIHLHVRDTEERHLLDADAYRAATAAIRREAGDGLIVQITTEAVGRYSRAEQMSVVREARPEAVSLAIRELAPDAASEAEAAAFFAWLREARVWPQFILYDAADIRRFEDMKKRGLIPFEDPFVLLVLGTRKAPAEPAILLEYLPELPKGVTWAVCAFGPREAACTLTAAAIGGHSRVGFENNRLFPDGQAAPDNAALVGRMQQGAVLLGRPVASGAQARETMLQAAFR